MQFSPEVLNKLADALAGTGVFALQSDLNRFVSQLANRAVARIDGGNDFSLTRAIRGLSAEQGKIINRNTLPEDLDYAKRALTTTTTPGSYLVPTVQANEIIEILSLGGVARKSGVRIWGLEGIQKLVAPTATAFPTVEFLGQNTSQTATDPNLGQVSFDLKTRRALVAIPNELLVSSTPAYDRLLAELLGEAFAEHEDSIFFDSTAASGGPTPFYAASGTTTHLVGESANGGNLAYTDLLRTLRKSAEAKAKGSLAWYCSPRTFFDRILGLLDGNSRPVVTQDAVGPVPYKLFGWPVFVTPAVPNDLTNGSGSSQSYLMLANPKYLHIAQSGGIEIATSTEAAFATNQTLVRIAQGLDFAVAPAAGVTILKGVN